MRAFLCSFLIAGASGVVGCSEPVNPPDVRSLEGSGKTALLCRDISSGEGLDMRACPVSEDVVTTKARNRHTMALVTQKLRGEVAVVDLDEDVEEVVDQNPYVPGTEHLPIGANPTSIVTTPGGVASFVGIGEPGRWSIFALPTTCIAPPKDGEPAREITLWSSCRLPSAPGEMVIAVDPTENGNTKTCAPAEATDWIAAANREKTERRDDGCSANLEDEQETSPKGRRKLVVTLPDDGKIAIYDAQTILNLPAGSFDNCVPDRVIALSNTVGAEEIVQPIPSDLVAAASCDVAPPKYQVPQDDSVTPRPAGIALAGSTLYVSDYTVPLVHTVDLSDPCNAKETEPLRPLSYNSPTAKVFTRDVAVSDLMPSGKRYVYALDDQDDSSVMVFDISPGNTSRAPVVRSHSPELQNEAPDRIKFNAPVKDLLLVKHDVPASISANETAEVGVLCDPNPAAKQPGSLYRTDSDYTDGAGPTKLRGLFGMAALASGQIAAIDIEDWDAPCRRPATNNRKAGTTDWLGCTKEPWTDSSYPYKKSASLTVTDEASCNVIEPHRLRSGKYFASDPDYGNNAANLEGLPLLTGGTTDNASNVTVDRDKMHPKMLAVPYEDVTCADSDSKWKTTPPFTYVGTTKYFTLSMNDQNCSSFGESVLDTDPALAQENSLLLPMHEPRVYVGAEEFSATYEGVVVNQREGGQLPTLPTGYVDPDLKRTLTDSEMLFIAPDGGLCTLGGVQDYAVTYGVGQELGLSDATALATFAKNHSDFVLLMTDFDNDTPYYESKGLAKSCGAGDDLRKACEEWFGTSEDPTELRELSIREAFQNQMVVTPRAIGGFNGTARAISETVKRIHCCFPGGVKYEVRAPKQWVVRGSSLLHDIDVGAGSRCVKDCSPRRAKLKNRVFEVSSSATECEEPKEAGVARPECFIGPSDKAAKDEVCVVSGASGGVNPSRLSKDLAAGCVFESTKARFAIYRGLYPSTRDMTFTWKVIGGFTGLAVTTVSTTTGQSVLPEHMIYSESLDALVVTDGVSGGLNRFSLVPFASMGQPIL